MPISSGTRLGSYELVAQIGAGGMGEVYRAHDTKLGREVAIKVLPEAFAHDPERLSRFQREAKMLASLNHTNIATIHGLEHSDGTHFLIMELVSGETLADRIKREGAVPVEEALKIAVQIAEALEAAHDKGVIHRDLKPANVKVTPEGKVKVLDFGLAKAFAGDVADSNPSQSPTLSAVATMQGVLLGTAAYMSPEQARGKAVDKRTDIWAFGCVLYELLTGRQAFRGETAQDTIAAVLERELDWQALPPPTPAQIRNLLRRCLQKDPQRRLRDLGDARIEIEETGTEFTSAAQEVSSVRPAWHKAPLVAVVGAILIVAVGAALWRTKFGAAGQPQIHSIAVLPLQNFSGDPNQEYFADGTTEALISSLAQIHSLQVISRTSVMRYKGTTKPLPEIGRELGADVIVEGSVQRSGGRVRIAAQLIRASTDKHLWANNYDRDLSDVLKLEAEVAQAVAREIQTQITPAEATRLASARSVMPEAHEEFLLGRFYSWKQNSSDLKEAISHFNKAIQLNPDYADAYASLAGAWQDLGGLESLSRARAAAQRALDLDSNLAEAHAALAALKAEDWDWAGAEREFREALTLNPDSEDSCACYALFLYGVGRLPEALAVIQHAAKVNPLSSFVQLNYGIVLYGSRKYDDAVAHLQRAIELEPRNFAARNALAQVYEVAGKSQEAVALLDRPGVGPSASLRLAYASAGRRAEAVKMIQELTKPGSSPDTRTIALIYFALGDKDRGFMWLTRAFDERHTLVKVVRADPIYDGVRSDPRFQALVARLKLPD